MITLKSAKQNFELVLPNNVTEITVEQLDAITANVKLPEYYCIVALCFTTSLFNFVTAIGSNNRADIGVIPVLAKVSDQGGTKINAAVGDRLIISRTSLERGVHINLPTMINSDAVAKFIAKDDELRKSIVTSTFGGLAKEDIVVMNFKIIPVNEVSAAVPAKGDVVVDPFRKVCGGNA